MLKKHILINLSLIICLLTTFAATQISAQTRDFIEVLEIKEVGISDLNEAKSVIEIRWQANPAQVENVRSFKILLSVIYADGTKTDFIRHTDEESSSVQIEVPSVSFSKRNAPAFIKNLKAVVIAESKK